MATEVRRRRGTTIEHSTFTGAVAELTVDLTKDTVVVHDGATQGGFPLLREDFSNVPTTAPFTNISLDTAIFDTTYTETGSETQGTLYWNSDEETLSLVTNGESIELGQKVEVHVKNQTGAQINKGEVVYASGTVGASGRILVTKMIADGTVAAKRVLGVAAENIADGADGKVIKFGKLRQINTSTFSNGDILWVSTTTAGGFQNTEPVQANGEISLPIAYVVYSSASVGEIFVRVTPIDENEYQDYDAQLTTLSGLSADQAQDLVDITASEYTQLQNINSVTISNTQWGYLGELNQSLTQASSPTFGGLTVNGNITVTGTVDGRDVAADGANLDELYTTIGLSALTSDEVDQLENIGTTTISATQWGYLGVLDQNLRTTDAVTFATLDTGQGANELYAMNQDVQTTDDVTFNIINVSDSITDASTTYSAGITGAGTIYDMNDGNGSFFEVDNMRIRNELRAHIFKKDIVKASNAYLFITDSAEIAEFSDIIDTTNTFKVLDETNNTNATFEHGDLLWAKNVEDDGSLQVTGVKIQVSAQPKYVWDNSTQVWNADPSIAFSGYTDEFASGTVSGGIYDGKPYKEYNIYEVTAAGKLNAGDTIVRVSGASILNDASSAQSPFIDIYDGVQTWAQFQDVSKTKVRLGNLAGVSNASGYGLYTQNAFLTGALVVGDLTKAGQYMEFNNSTLTVQGNIVVQGGSGIASFTDAGAFATLDTATLSLISDAGAMAGIDSITSGNATTYIGSGAITTGLIAANTIVAGNIAANTITASEIAANTITASEIDVDNLFAQEIEVTGKLLATDGTYETTVGKLTGVNVKIGAFTSNGDFYGLYRDIHNYFGIHDGDVFAEYAFRVGDANNYLEFDGTDLSIATDAFTLETTNLSIDSDNEVITLGSGTTVTVGKIDATNFGLSLNANNFWKVSSGEYFFKVGTATNFISFNTASGTLDIETDTFELTTSNIRIDSSFDRTNSNITSSVTYSDTLQFAGLFFDSDNYLGHITDVDTSANSGYLFRVGGATSNFLEVNEAGSIAKIVFDTFTLDATDASGGIKIDSANELIQLEDANRVRTQVDVNNGAPTVSPTSHINDITTHTFDSNTNGEYTTSSTFQVTEGDSIRINVQATLDLISGTNADRKAQFQAKLLFSTTSGGTYNEVASAISQVFSHTNDGDDDTVSFSYHSYTSGFYKVQLDANAFDGDASDVATFDSNLIDVDSFPSVTRVSLDGVYVQNNDKQYAQLTRTKNELSGQIFLKNLPDSDPSISGQLYRDSSGNLKVSL